MWDIRVVVGVGLMVIAAMISGAWAIQHASMRQTRVIILAPALSTDENCYMAIIQPDKSVKFDWGCVDRNAAKFSWDAPSQFGSIAVTIKAAKEQSLNR